MQLELGITTYDEDKMLWGTDIGNMILNKLYVTVWEETEESSKAKARVILLILTGQW